MNTLCDCSKFGVNNVDTNYGKGGYDWHQHEIRYGHYDCGYMYFTPKKPLHSSTDQEIKDSLKEFHKIADKGCWKCGKPVFIS